MPYNDTIMTSPGHFDNRLKALRQARGWTQDQLAQTAGLSRTGVSAIEAQRLVPSVAAALGLARALDCSVEDIFGARQTTPHAHFAWLPASFPCRYWLAEVGGRTLLFPVESALRSDLAHDGVARHAGDFPRRNEVAAQTLVVATCDPAAGLLAASYERRSGGRMLVFSRSSAAALDLLSQGLAHVAGIHFSPAEDQGGNAAELVRRGAGPELDLLHVAQWEEGLASQPAARLRSASRAARSDLRWIGRLPGAAARRHQDELLGGRRSPRHIASDHRGVVEAIRGRWADVGVCLRLVTEEAGLSFLTIGQENYDLCFPRALTNDARIAHLVATVRSAEYRRLLAELPGYRPQLHLGDLEHVSPKK
jgi:molybdate-binding protein/DNA-binding XRE family transcriptional regulator